jgi:UDP:flavonoid glycosyltransferase YjiC (YdhE family)
MWGQKIVPQIKVLPLVDLVITHGGNNTFTETLFFGKPMIVMPLFSDQFDTAQRVQEKGFGVKLDPYNCKENELLESIEKLVNDEMLALKMIKISERIQSSNKISKIVELIEGLVN